LPWEGCHCAPTERGRLSASMSRTRPIRCSVDSSGHTADGVATRVARVLLERDHAFLNREGDCQAARDPSYPRRRRQASLPAALFPDLNPIEQVFAKLKTLLRKAGERTIEATWRRIGSLLGEFRPEECANYFKNVGYASA
jgi:hypothetical protein